MRICCMLFYFLFLVNIGIKCKKRENTTLSEQFQKSNVKIVERGKVDTPNTQIHDRSLSCLGTCTQ